MDLKTRRLSIRPFVMEDTDALFSILSDPAVMRFIEPPYTRSQTAAFITDQLRAEIPQAYALTENETGALVGHVIWQPYDSEAYELGWILARQHWGKGYATEMLKGMISYLFEHGFSEVIAGAFEENPASLRVMAKAGMTLLERSDELEYRGKVHRCFYYSKKKGSNSHA